MHTGITAPEISFARTSEASRARTARVGEGPPPNAIVHRAPGRRFGAILTQYVPGIDGFYWIWFDDRDRIQRAVVPIDTGARSRGSGPISFVRS